MNLKGFIVFLIFCLSHYLLVAQVDQSLRIEFEANHEYFNYNVVSIDSSRFLVLHQGYPERRGDTKWFIKVYDTQLKKLNEEAITVDKSYEEFRFFEGNGKFHITGYSLGDDKVIIYSWEIDSFKRTEVETQLIEGSSILDFVVINGIAYFPSFHRKTRNYIHRVDVATGIFERIWVETDAKKEISYLKTEILSDERTDECWFVYKTCRKKDCSFYVVPLNKEFDIKQSFTLKVEGENRVQDFSLLREDNEHIVFGGSFTELRRDSDASTGVFYSKVNKEKIESLTFKKFGEMKNFFNYLPDSRRKRVEKKKQKKKDKGKEIRANYNVACHKVLRRNGEYILIGEVYFPTYRSVSPLESNRVFYEQIFDGYQYSHTVVVAFDDKGEYLWDHCFEMWLSNKPMEVKEFVHVAKDENELKLMYANGKHIKTVAFKRGKISREVKKEEIATGKKDDILKGTWGAELIHWYGNHFLTWGYQKVKNKKNKDVKRTRKVYFVNKLTFE